MSPLRTITLSLVLITSVSAAELIAPKAIDRDKPFLLLYKTGRQTTGKGTLRVDWTNSDGRQVESLTFPVGLTDQNEFRFSLDGRRAVAMQNNLHAHFSFSGKNKKGETDIREEDASASFIASPPDRTWWDYLIIMWQPNTAGNFAELKSSASMPANTTPITPVYPSSS